MTFMTTRRLPLALLSASLLGGCACFHTGGPSPSTPQVSVVAKSGPGPFKPAVTVYPDPLFFRKGQTNVRITWELQPELGLKFPADGIVIDGEIRPTKPPGDARSKRDDSVGILVLDKDQKEVVDCKPAPDGLSYSCLYIHSRPGVFKYTVRVLQDGKPLDPLDPSLMGN